MVNEMGIGLWAGVYQCKIHTYAGLVHLPGHLTYFVLHICDLTGASKSWTRI